LSDAGAETAIWREPVRGGYPHPGVMSLPGLERLRQFRSLGSPPPPLFHLTGAQPTRFGEGTAEAEMPASPWLLNSAGLIGGGTLAILADIAFGCSVETRIPAATPYTTAELSLTFLRPVGAGGRLTAGGQAIHVGRSVGLSEAFLLDEGERLVAHGTSRLAIMPPLDGIPALPEDLEPQVPPEPETPDPYLREPAAGAVVPQEAWSELPGAEVLARQLSGELPAPAIHYLTGLQLRGADGGSSVMTLPASEWLASPTGFLQGGTIAMLADAAMQTAVVSTAGPGTAIAGLDLKVNYLRPAPADGRELTARAEIVHSGRTLAITRSEVANADGKPVALATGSSMHLSDRPAALGDAEFPSSAPSAPDR
jgi:uncharacterized protein (TIGR00369 family)